MEGRSVHRTLTVEQMRAIIGPPHPLTIAKVLTELDDEAVRFVARSPFVILGTVDAAGVPEVSPKGDEPGFVRVSDARTLVIPERKGNRLAFGLQNVIANPNVGLLFMVPGMGETLRIEGVAELSADPALLDQLTARGQPALLAMTVAVSRCFFHCARALRRSKLWEPDTWPEPEAISFGRIIARQTGGGPGTAAAVDARVEDGYLNEL